MTAAPDLDLGLPPVVTALRALYDDLLDKASTAVDAMRDRNLDDTSRLGQAERALAMHEAAADVRAALDVAENEGPTRP
jgi:uncharacterized glyoxalase superfamily metalloenzyme YdcJ